MKTTVYIIIFLLFSSIAQALPTINFKQEDQSVDLSSYYNKSLVYNKTEIDGYYYSSAGGWVNDSVSTNTSLNVSVGSKLVFKLSEFIDNLVDGWLRVTGGLRVTEDVVFEKNLNVSGNLSYSLNINPSQPAFYAGWCGDNYVIGNLTRLQSKGYCI